MLVNFSEQPQVLDLSRIVTAPHATDLLTETRHPREAWLTLASYGVVWLHENAHTAE